MNSHVERERDKIIGVNLGNTSRANKVKWGKEEIWILPSLGLNYTAG